MDFISFLGGADAAPGDGIVSIPEPSGIIDHRIPEVSRQYEGQAAIPGGRLARQSRCPCDLAARSAI